MITIAHYFWSGSMVTNKMHSKLCFSFQIFKMTKLGSDHLELPTLEQWCLPCSFSLTLTAVEFNLEDLESIMELRDIIVK